MKTRPWVRWSVGRPGRRLQQKCRQVITKMVGVDTEKGGWMGNTFWEEHQKHLGNIFQERL